MAFRNHYTRDAEWRPAEAPRGAGWSGRMPIAGWHPAVLASALGGLPDHLSSLGVVTMVEGVLLRALLPLLGLFGYWVAF